MKLVLHVGMAKSGSTAIQRGLVQLQDRLLARGYLYPKGLVTPHNQSSLIVAAVPPEKLPRYFLPRYQDQSGQVARDFARWIDGIREQVGRQRPKALLMSGQTLFELSRPDQFEKLAAVLRPLADEVEIVAYLRRPSEFYLASAQQILKADHRIRPLAPVEYRAALEGFAAIADRLHVFKYDRALFPGGDALRHFVEAFCPDLSGEELPRLDANVSLSAEGMALLAAYRRCHHSDKPRQFVSDASLLLKALGKADDELPDNRRARLKADLARAIDEGSTDLLWLRDAWGIVFDGVDYGRIAPMGARRQPKRVGEICLLDPKRRTRVTLHTFRHLAEEAARERREGDAGQGKVGKGAAGQGAGCPARSGWLWSSLRPLVGGRRR